ncbi:MAG: PD-(D/E)XK nuclease family protein [Candidatus Helarchaeota archaeon]
MKWSFSKSKIFLQCQRKWFYSEIFANANTKDLSRRRAYKLKQLQSISAWRGSLVDKVIEKLIIPKINRKMKIVPEEVIKYAINLMREQIDFGMNNRYLEEGITKSNSGDKYCAFYDLRYKSKLDKNDLLKAEKEIKTALTNLLNSKLIKNLLYRASYLIPQRPLTVKYAGSTISCTPDLIAFYYQKPPLIIDWKVHTFGDMDYKLQLGIYAFILSKIKPHKDFLKYDQNLLRDPKNYRLIEFQLLRNKIKEYKLSEQDIIDIQDYIFVSLTQMKRLIGNMRNYDLSADKFMTAYSPDICMRCQFREICWERDGG